MIVEGRDIVGLHVVLGILQDAAEELSTSGYLLSMHNKDSAASLPPLERPSLVGLLNISPWPNHHHPTAIHRNKQPGLLSEFAHTAESSIHP